MMVSYTRLRDGSWGIRVEGGTVKAGSRVTVTKKSGETKAETVARVLWSDRGVSLCSVVATGVAVGGPRSGSGSGSRSDREYCGHPCPVTGRRCCPANGPCHDCE